MARMKWSGQYMTVLAARQSDLTTENVTGASFTAFAAAVDVPDHAQEQEDFSDLAAGQFAAYEPPAPGSRSGGTISMRFPLECLKSGYDPTSEDPGAAGVISPAMVLLGNALGSGGAAAVSSDAEFWQGYHLARTGYHAGSVNAVGSTTSQVKVDDQSYYTAGALALWGTTASEATPSIGWAKTLTNDTQDLVDLFEAMAVAPANADDAFGTATAYLSGNEPVPLTMHILGDNAAFKYAYIGCVATRVKLDWMSGKTPMVEIDWMFTARKRYGSGGGLTAPADFTRARPFLGRYGGRFTVDGTATCGWGDFSVEANFDIIPVECPNKEEGVSEFVRKLATVAVNAQIPIDSGDSISNNNSPMEEKYANGTTMTIAGYSGQTIGGIASMLLPAVKLAEAPQLVDINGILGESIVARPAAYSGDDGSAAPADTLLRVAVG